MLESIVTSKARIKLLLRLLLNPHVRAYLRELSTEFGGSSNAVRVELNRLVEAKILKVEEIGRNKYYSANTEHPLYPEINSILRKTVGLDQIYDHLSAIGNLEQAYLTGDYACGIDGGIVDLLLVGNLDKHKVMEKILKLEELVKRKIRTLIFSMDEFKKNNQLSKKAMLLLWGNNGEIQNSELKDQNDRLVNF